METGGFEHDPWEDIAALQDLLGEQYKPESILKELVQNADDGQADSIHICMHPGLAGAGHPLLQTQALAVLNDGKFEAEHAKFIRYLRVGSKAADQTVIGKFGLGMKSIFHICEAFFYVASSNQDAAQGKVLMGVLNPWSGTGVHNHWDRLGEGDKQRLVKWVEDWGHNAKRWFCLWLPIRNESILEGKTPLGRNERVAAQLISREVARSSAQLFPFLRSLKRIAFWVDGKPKFTVALEEGSDVSAYPALAMGKRRSFDRQVCISGATETDEKLLITGVEAHLSDKELRELQDRTEWPRKPAPDPKTGRIENQRDKALPHAGVALTCTPIAPGSSATLETRHAVFLPLAEALGRSHCSGGKDFRVLLHGCFFLDSGRRRLLADADDVPCTWNRILFERGVVPLLLPALEAFARKLTPEEIRSLTKGLVDLIRGPPGSTDPALLEGQWLFAAHAQGGAYQLLPPQQDYWQIPVPEDGSDTVPFNAIPALKEIAKTRCITFPENFAPRLTSRQPAHWVDVDWLEGLKPAVALGDMAALAYLVSFVTQEREALPPEAWARLICLARDSLGTMGPRALREMGSISRDFFGLLPATKRVAFPQPPKSSVDLDDAILGALNRLGLQKVLVSEDLDEEGRSPQSANKGTFSLEECSRVLGFLADSKQFGDSKRKLPDESRSTWAVRVLQRTPGTILEKRNTVGSLQLFRVHDHRLGEERLVSWDALEELRAKGVLFSRSGPMTSPLQRALASDHILHFVEPVSGEVSRMLFLDASLPYCDTTACVELLSRKPTLAAPEERVDLLKAALAPTPSASDSWRRTTRYLLHSSPANYEDASTLLLVSPPPGDESPVWGRLSKHLVNMLGEGWCWVPDELSRNLSPTQMEKLGVQAVSASSVGTRLRRAGPSCLTDIPLTPAERNIVLESIDDPTLWRELPLHETLDGKLISLPAHGRAFLEADGPFPERLKPHVRILRRPTSADLNDRYQKAGVRPLDDGAAVVVALGLSTPESYCMEILDSIGRMSSREMTDSMKSDLCEKSWLVTAGGRAVAPQYVVDLPEMSAEIAELLRNADLDREFTQFSMLLLDVRGHPAMGFVREALLPPREKALDLVAGVASGASEWILGNLPELDESPENLSLLVKAFGDYAKESPPIRLLKAACQAMLVEQVWRHLAKPLMESDRPLPPNVLVQRLCTVKRGLEALPMAERKECEQVYLWHLRLMSRLPGSRREGLSGIPLMNKKGEWKEAAGLCCDVPGIDDACLLDGDQAEAIRPVLDEPEPVQTPAAQSLAQPASSSGPAAALLRAYFAPWQSAVPDSVIGGFMALMGDEPELLTLAAEYLGPFHHIDTLRQRLSWHSLRKSKTMMAMGGGEDVRAAMQKQRFAFKVIDVGTQGSQTATNLLGKPFQAAVSRRVDSLFVGDFLPLLGQGYRCFQVTLRKLEPTSFSRDQLVQILEESARHLLSMAYCQSPGNLQEIWDDLKKSPQSALEIAQDLVLGNAFFYFRQLTSIGHKGIRALVRRWDELRYRQAEEERNGRASGRGPARSFKQDFDMLRADLQRVLTGDREVQAALIAALRHKIGEEYRYQANSIPFELFQNADDSVVQLQEMLQPAELKADARRFVCESCGNSLLFVHWGRPINQFTYGGFDARKGQERGFHRDLEQMLLLSTSDKSETPGSVTGKFGLGFKSCLLATDSPNVVSGQLAFRVVAGMFPEHLAAADRTRLAERATRHAVQHSKTSTLIELSCFNDRSTVADVLGRFRALAHLLVVFSRSVRAISFVDEGKPSSCCWSPSKVGSGERVLFGQLMPLDSGSAAATHGMQLGGKSGSSLLIGLSLNGVERLADQIPSIWVMAPTCEELSLGFAVNGPFPVDVGRARLASDDSGCVEAAGLDIGEALTELYQATRDWDVFRSQVMLTNEVRQEVLWRGIWDLFTQENLTDETPAARLIKRILWGPGKGMRLLVERHSVVPSGLPGDYSCLTSVERIAARVEGALGKPGCFAGVAALGGIGARYAPGTLVTKEVAEGIERFGMSHRPWTTIKLKDVLIWEIGQEGRIAPPLASRLGALLPAWHREVDGAPQVGSEELDEIKEKLGRACFMNRASQYVPGQTLVVSSGTETEESARAEFAPADNILDAGYDAQGIEWVRFCRGALSAPAERLAEWGCKATETRARAAFLKYLLKGELAYPVKEYVRKRRHNTWMDAIPQQLLEEFTPAQRLELWGALGFDTPGELGAAHAVAPADSAAVLHRLYDWWMGSKAERLPQYLQDLYPEPEKMKSLVRQDFAPDNVEQREAWLTVLLRGVQERMGWGHLGQQRGFLQLAKDEGWLRKLADPDESRRGLDAQVRDYLDRFSERVPYLHWLGCYVPLCIMAHWLEDYVRSVLTCNQHQENLSVDMVFNPRANHLLSGTGIDAPPLSPVLGIGRFFIIRELCRWGVVTHQALHRYCFAPGQKVRQLILAVGGPADLETRGSREEQPEQAKQIHEFLQSHLHHMKWKFDGDFDIPLRIVAGDQNLCMQLLQRALPDGEGEDDT